MHDTLTSKLLLQIAKQMQQELTNLQIALDCILPEEQRMEDSVLDRQMAIWDLHYHRLLRLITNLLNTCSLSSDTPFSMTSENMASVIKETCDDCESFAQMSNITLQFICTEDKLICNINKVAIQWMIFHLLSNAFKATHAGGQITVELKLRESTKKRFMLISVTDTGCETQNQPSAQEKSSKSTDSSPYEFGLGLNICQQIAELHGGTIHISQLKKRGTEVVVTLPFLEGEIFPHESQTFKRSRKALLPMADAISEEAFLVNLKNIPDHEQTEDFDHLF